MLGAAIPGSPTRTGRTPVHRAGGGMSILVERLCLAAVCVSTTAPGQIPMPVVVT